MTEKIFQEYGGCTSPKHPSYTSLQLASKARIFYKLINGIFFSDLGSRRRKNINKKALKNDQLTGHLQSLF